MYNSFLLKAKNVNHNIYLACTLRSMRSAAQVEEQVAH